jgi:hypothetical protein
MRAIVCELLSSTSHLHTSGDEVMLLVVMWLQVGEYQGAYKVWQQLQHKQHCVQQVAGKAAMLQNKLNRLSWRAHLAHAHCLRPAAAAPHEG